ncbi:MAG TPA: NnrU family protein, partial [Alteraurantiacibacter sp.]
MDAALIPLLAASIAFVGSHFAMSHPLRAPMVRALGEKGFLGVYSLVSLATFAWMIWEFRNSPSRMEPVWSGYDEVSWTIASLLTIVALVLLLGSFRGNPALPHPDEKPKFEREPRGVFRVTRHPMMWAFGLWGIAHILIMPTGRTLIF